MKHWVVNASVFVLCMVAGVWVFADRSLPAWLLLRELQASKLITYTPKKTSFTVEAPAFGELQAGSSTSISVPQVRTGGLKVFWIVKDGSAVKKGDTLVEFDASELIQHESKHDMLRQSLGSLKILARHDGLVLQKKEGWWMDQGTSAGDTRWPGTVILTIPDISTMKARVYVLESDAGNLRIGQTGHIVVDSHPGLRFNSTVERMETLARPL